MAWPQIRKLLCAFTAGLLLLLSACGRENVGAGAVFNPSSVTSGQGSAASLSQDEGKNLSEISSYIDPRPIMSVNCALIDAKTGELIDGKYIDDRVYPASLVKLMTLLIVSERCEDMDLTEFSVSSADISELKKRDAYRVGLEAGEMMTVRDLMYCAALASGADAAVALAKGIAGSEAAFVDLMNTKATQFGMTDTVFANCTGLHSSSQVSSVTNLARLMRYVMQDEFCKNLFSTLDYTTSPTSRHPDGITVTSNALSTVRDCGIDPRIQIIAGKTGFIRKSLYCMVTYARSDSGAECIFVSLGAEYKSYTVSDMIYFYELYML